MINFEDFTVDNGAIRDLRELLFTSVYNDPDLERVATMRTEVKNGKKLGYLDSLGDVGVPGEGCDPTYTGVNITGLEKTWELGDWEIAKNICYKDLENTLAEYGMNGGTEAADLTTTPYWTVVLIPLLQKAYTEMFWRLAWFGDKAAKNCTASGIDETGGGTVTDTVDPALLKPCDGLWKRLLAIIATSTGQKTEIAANEEATYVLQKTKIRESGVAIGIVDNLLSDADSRIFDYADHAIMMTNSLFKALRNDVVDKYGKTTMPFELVSAGIGLSEYDGHSIIVLDIWDRLIKKFEDNGTTLNCPHRAVVCSPSNLFIGTTDKDRVASLTVKFDDRKRDNYIFAGSNLGTLVGEDVLVQVAI